MTKLVCVLFFAMVMSLSVAQAQEVGIAKGISNVLVETDDGPIKIERNQDTNNLIAEDFAKTSRPCPPFCVQPMKVADGVETYGELEIVNFLKNKEGMLIDARTEEWHFKGTIPSSVNIPYVEIAQRMDELGCDKSGKAWDCKGAKKVVLYCNGPWCGQSPVAIKALLRDGYPADKIKYYRGGMQAWHALGLTVVEGGL
ncbi:rhodanese-like domain-containing protein [Terasakiella sp. A23]|uniref:rhodanese-like domain-containing protein n=1 Tax=Terasakiella sp. FCG-A23 TaxID=3080561 RepID=UPI0029542F49|nr:rhodanese-like domain-containing protein [Terasakiella sp. A23]MDV7340916.1 rhodanese-like domain-containing protein [Terasakiella sp. A23]